MTGESEEPRTTGATGWTILTVGVAVALGLGGGFWGWRAVNPGAAVPFAPAPSSSALASVEPSFPPGFVYETILSGLKQATSMVFLPEMEGERDLLLIAEKEGRIRVAERGSAEDEGWTLLPEPFLDLPEVNAALDRGLLSIAVHPMFPIEPFVYALYSFDSEGLPASISEQGSRVMRVQRFTADPERGYRTALPGSGTTILGRNSTLENVGDPSTPIGTALNACQGAPTAPYVEDCIPSDSNNHSGGMLLFARDWTLLVATGDATFPIGQERSIRAQHLESLAGKILRIDPMTGEGLLDNPFYDGNPSSNRSRVLHYGLRNPFRIAEDLETGAIYIGDVGWNDWEELNAGPPGSNFGWPCYEGGAGRSLKVSTYAGHPDCVALYRAGPEAVRPPWIAYPHARERGSIILGSIYRGAAYPVEYRGGLFFYDFLRTWIRVARFDVRGVEVFDFATGAGRPNHYADGIVQIVSGPEGDLYTVNLSTIRRIRFAPDPSDLRVSLEF